MRGPGENDVLTYEVRVNRMFDAKLGPPCGTHESRAARAHVLVT